MLRFQLCELLKIKQNVPYSLPAPVEPALEANEASSNKRNVRTVDATPNVVRIPTGSVPPLQIATNLPRKTQISDAHAKREFVRNIQQENQNFEIQARTEDVILPTPEDLTRKPDGNGKARYEIPENHITRTAAKIIGSRRELEMHEFLTAKKLHGSVTVTTDKDDAVPTIDPSGDRRHSPNDD